MIKKFLAVIRKVLFFEFFDTTNEVNYIGTGNVLPKALKLAEERALVAEMHTDEAKQKLIEHNLRLVIYVAKKFDNVDVDMHDLISIGSIGLIKAINSFKGDKNIKIATYASKCIENEILMHLRKINKQKREVSLDDPISSDNEGNNLMITDLVSCDEIMPHHECERQAEVAQLWQILDKLTEREKEIMIMRFGLSGKLEKTQKEVADDLGISQSYISRLEKKIMLRIKKEIIKLN